MFLREKAVFRWNYLGVDCGYGTERNAGVDGAVLCLLRSQGLTLMKQIETVEIPEYVQYFMKNYAEGYTYGYRDAINHSQYVTNFSLEKHGFMTGYFQGYSDGTEKRRERGGRNVAMEAMNDIRKDIEKLIIVPELDRTGGTAEEAEEYRERVKARMKRKAAAS